MTFQDGVWTLSRSQPDLSPLDFHQRWRGTFSPDGTTITGRWEQSAAGADWKHDVDLHYQRIG
jgi:hypothetical protein